MLGYWKFFILCNAVINMIDQSWGRIYPTYPMYHHHPSSDSSSDGPTPTFPDPALPPANQQDKDDAAAIVKGNFNEKDIASILPARTLEHRKIINNEIAIINHKKPLIHRKYLPTHKNNPPSKDLWFALLNYPITVLAMYLGEFLHYKDETYIIMVLTLCQEMEHLTYTYNQNHKNSLKKRRRKQRHPFANLMKVWVARDRGIEFPGVDLTDEDLKPNVEDLKQEYLHWNDKRDSLELTLIELSIKVSSSVIRLFEADIKMSIEDAIKDKIKNHDLVDAYTSLALYVKNKHHYMAKTLLEHCDGTYNWAIWIMYIGFVDAKDWPLIDEEFQKISNNETLRDHILKNPEPDKIFLDVMAEVIDPKYKPNYL